MQADREKDSEFDEIVANDDAIEPGRRWFGHYRTAANGEYGSIPLRNLRHERPRKRDRFWQIEQLRELQTVNNKDRVLDGRIAADQKTMFPVAFHRREIEIIG